MTTRQTQTQTQTKTTTTPLPSLLLEQKIDNITAGLPASYGNNLRLLSNIQNQNVSTIIQYIQAMKTETSHESSNMFSHDG